MIATVDCVIIDMQNNARIDATKGTFSSGNLRPHLNTALTICVLKSLKPTADGTARNSTEVSDFIRRLLYSSCSSTAYFLDSDGSTAVPIPMAKMPYGSCQSVLAFLKAARLPSIALRLTNAVDMIEFT